MDKQWINNVRKTAQKEDISDQELVALYKLTDTNTLKVDPEASWKNLRSEISGNPLIIPYLYRWAAVALVCVGIGLTYFLTRSSDEMIHFSAEGKTELTLPDRSVVLLNKGASISYPEEFKEERTVSFTGEGFFRITKDEDPFVIEVQQVSVQVLGTSFNLNSNAQKVELAVVTGVVAMKSGAEKKKVEAGQQAVYSRSSKKIVLSELSHANVNSWYTGQFEFHNTLLTEALEAVGKHYEVEFTIPDHFKTCRITGSFKQPDLKAVVEILETILNATITHQGNRLILSGPGC